MGGAQDWVDDLTDPDDGDDEEDTSLFEDNFRTLVEDGDVESMNLQTLEDQIDRVDDVDLLEEALEVDERKGSVEIYEGRIEEIEGENEEQEDEDDDVLVCEECGYEADGPQDMADHSKAHEQEEEDEPDEEEESEEEEANDVNDVLEQMNGDDDEDADEEDSSEDDAGGAEDDAEEEPEGEDAEDPEPDEADESSESEPTDDSSGLPEVDVSSIAPGATTREEAAAQDSVHSLLVWGPEGSGKSHIAHSAPEPICVIDTEGKADELAAKFDKEIYYWHPEDYQEAVEAMEEAFDVLGAYLDKGVRGTLVVDSMSVMWEWAQIDYAKKVYQTEDLSEVNFGSQLQGEKDWSAIKARHNDDFRDEILDSPFHVVMTSGQKEDYNAVFEGAEGKPMKPDGEKHNKYAVKDVVRLRREDGETVGDLYKAALTRYAFKGLPWPEWDDIREKIQDLFEAEMSDDPVNVEDWEVDVVKGQPITKSEGSASDEDEGGDDAE